MEISIINPTHEDPLKRVFVSVEAGAVVQR